MERIRPISEIPQSEFPQPQKPFGENVLPKSTEGQFLKDGKATPLIDEIRLLRGQGASIPEIARNLEEPVSRISNLVRAGVNSGEIERKRDGKKRSKDSYVEFLGYLVNFQGEYPFGALTLSQMAKPWNFSRERARQIYGKLSEKHALPPKSGTSIKKLPETYLAGLDQEVRNLFDQNLTPEQIAVKMHVPLNWVSTIQKIEKKKQKMQAGEEIRRQIAGLRNEGIRDREIAKRLGLKDVSQLKHIIQQLINTGEIEKKKQRKPPSELPNFDLKVEELRREGLTRRQIARQMGPDVSVSLVDASLVRLKKIKPR